MAKGAEAEVLATVRAHGEAMKAGDVNALVAFYSEDWKDNHGATKDSLKDRYQGTGDKGGREDMEFDLSAAKVVVDGDIATITPVTLTSSRGSITHTHKLRKEAGGVWRLVYTEGIDWDIIALDAEGRRRLAEDNASALTTRNLRDGIQRDPCRPGYLPRSVQARRQGCPCVHQSPSRLPLLPG